MRVRLLLSLACAAVIAAAPALARADGARYLVSLQRGYSSGFAAQVAALGGRVETLHAGAGLAVVSGVADPSALAALKGVAEVEPDATLSLDSPLAPADADALASEPSSAADPTTASRYPWQWNMRDIGADKAWAAGKLGSESVTAAILDTGIDYDAPDLAGLVDLSRSASFIPADDEITHAYFPTRDAITDYHGHGTNVATQVSSKARALAGVTSKTTLIGVKVLSARGSGDMSAILNGVLFAADQGADVANMSLGGGFAKAGQGRFVGLINKVFNYATSRGTLIVVSAGNDGADLDHDGNFHVDFCTQPGVVCVASEGLETWNGTPDVPAFYTNYGRSAITVAAPGGNGLVDSAGNLAVTQWPWGAGQASWVWSYCSKTRLVFDEQGNMYLTACVAGNRLTGYIGTSQAAPHVTGLAALLVAEQGRGHPAQIAASIRRSALDLGQPGTDPFYGQGRIDVARALGL